MQCRSCGTSILTAFKHAMAQNECPACGGQIMDEESLALIENIEITILNEAAVREETAHQLAMALVTRYDVTIRDTDQLPQVAAQQVGMMPKTQKSTPHKIAPPSKMKQAIQQGDNLIQASEIPEGISDRERDEIFEEAVRKKYNIVDQVQGDVLTNGDFEETQESAPTQDSVFSEGADNPILERERIARLAKQQQAMNGGGQGLFRRSG